MSHYFKKIRLASTEWVCDYRLKQSWSDLLFEIINPPKCTVGEAYGFSRSYTDSCKECGNIGDKFTLYFTLRLSSKLEENKKELEHMFR